MSEFKIDFFELAFLAEVCIPPRPIARAMFWKKLINEHYRILLETERHRLFQWITENHSFDLKNEDCELFYNRFNPDNQFEITTKFEGKIKKTDCFLHKGKYHTNETTSVSPEFITKIKKISFIHHV